MPRQSKHHRAGAVDHLPSEIMIGAPANAAEPGFAAGCILPRHKADPCCKLSAGPEMPAIINCGDERCRDHRANARQFRESAACFVRAANDYELRIELLKSMIEAAELVEHIAEDPAHEIRQIGVCDGGGRLPYEAPCALRQNNAILAKQSPHMVDKAGSSTDDTFASAVK